MDKAVATGDERAAKATRRPRGRVSQRLGALALAAVMTVGGLAGVAAPAVAIPAAGVTSVYVANINANTVSVVDTATNTVTATIPVGSHPISAVATPDGAHVYILNLSDNNVSVIDTATNTVTDTIPVGTVPIASVINPAGTDVYVADLVSQSVSVIDTATNTVTATIVGLPGNPTGEAINAAGTTLYVANGNNVSVIDTASNTITTTIGGIIGTDGVAVTPSGSTLYVTESAQDKVTVIDTATNAVTATIPTATSTTDVVVNAAGTLAYVSSQSGGDVIVIDTATNAVTATIATGAFTDGLAFTPDGAHLYVANENSNNVSVIDTATDTVTATVAVGTAPVAIAISTLPAPVVTSISPNSGPAAGGTVVTVTGTNLGDATAVTFGPGNSATAVSCTATSCSATAPPEGGGTVDVQVTTAGGTSAISTADQYSYQATTATTVDSSANPSAFGQPVTFTASVTGTDGGGTVAFYADGSATALSGCDAVALVDPPKASTATCTTSNLAVGNHVITASYTGDTLSVPSSATLSGGQTVNPLVSTLAVTAPSSVAAGTPVSANATLAGASTNPGATGQIGFAVFPGNCGSSGPGTPVPPPDNVTGDGVYSSAAYTPTTPGNFSWAAFYTGDTDNSSAISNCASFTVTPATAKANPTLATATTPPATVPLGGTISDSATLAGGNNPTGQIGFAVFPSADCPASGPGVPVGSGNPALPANVTHGNGTYNSTASWTATALGNYSFAAYYNGDANNNAATSTCEPFTVSAGVAPTALTTTAATTATVGTPITDTATLTNGINPTGAIGFAIFPSFDCLASGPGTPVPQPITVTGNGTYTSATYTPTVAGSYSWAAFYTGDTTNSSSTSTCEPFTVSPATP